jgi:hypothetical protein
VGYTLFLRLGLAVLGLAACSCDDGLEIQARVVNSDGEPVPRADYLLEDRHNTDTPVMAQGWTDEAGTFERSITVSNASEHDFWLTVTKEAFQAHSERVWKGEGAPEEPIELEITLVPD